MPETAEKIFAINFEFVFFVFLAGRSLRSENHDEKYRRYSQHWIIFDIYLDPTDPTRLPL